jgi:hypothetical protein
LTTSEFENLARFQARAMGYPKLRILLIQHPLGGTPVEEALAKAESAVDSIVTMFEA